jgi:ribosomal protein S4E
MYRTTLVQVTRQQVGKGGVPYIATHDGRTIRYPDPDIRVRCCPYSRHLLCSSLHA